MIGMAHESIPPEIAGQVLLACAVIARHLGDTLRSIHLFGSAVEGGLKPGSDIDLLVSVSTPPADAARQGLLQELLTVSARPGVDGAWRPLEVTVVTQDAVAPWRHPARRELQFGEWLRADLLADRFEPPMTDPDLTLLLTQARRHSVAVVGRPARDCFDPVPAADFAAALRDTLAQWNGPADWQGDERNVVLALARIWYSAETGDIAAKDTAAAWLLERLPADHRPVLAEARAGYLGASSGLPLDPAAVAAFVGHARPAIEKLLGEG
ncbi:DUF4111 domain-containing protein [Cupriavidus pauculus]|uniref:Aminoglycoside (3'') (9) adenylyltransferase n=2 Tax=Cupriavidus pauculus TaxID=82633 RepID=A0A3G8H493_9BURK|nr:DUF4111 domain-containing protein [Cupriavidus pauculus]